MFYNNMHESSFNVGQICCGIISTSTPKSCALHCCGCCTLSLCTHISNDQEGNFIITSQKQIIKSIEIKTEQDKSDK